MGSSNGWTSGWTSGQYVVYRFLLGASLFVHLGLGSSGVSGWFGLGVAALFALGRADRIAAAAGVVLALTLGFYSAAVLLALHLIVPKVPSADGDPRDWSLPWGVLATARALVAGIWALALANGALDLAPGVLAAHLLALDPAWIRPVRAGSATLYYDGHCALCHATVRRLLAEDPHGDAFRFAPLQGASFAKARASCRCPAVPRAGELPDSVVLRTEDDTLLVRSEAALAAAARLGGLWRPSAALIAWLPAAWRDAAYDAIAARRTRWFGRTAEACPLVPADLRARFEE